MLVVWCADWPVVAAGLTADDPAAVLFANRVVACSAAARAHGVRRGLRRREAQARCPDMVVLERDEALEARAFEPVVGAVESLCPRVEIVRPGMCAFQTRGPSRYFGGDAALAERTAAAVASTGVFDVRCGIADGRLAAGLAARRALVVDPGGSAAFLAEYPVGELGLAELADLLRRLGVRTLGDFAALPSRDVLARFGEQSAEAHRMARGLDPVPLRARTPPPDLEVSAAIDPPADRIDTVAFAAKALADELHGKLEALALACTRIAIEVQTEDGRTLSRLWRHDGALNAQAIAQRLRWQLDAWLSKLSGGVSGGAFFPPDPDRACVGPTRSTKANTKADTAKADTAKADADSTEDNAIALLRLVPDEVKPAVGRQLGFWGGSADADERAGRALARVQAMLGHEAVATAVLGGGRTPSEQVRRVAWEDPREPGRPGEPDLGGEPIAIEGPPDSPQQRPGREVPAWPGRIPPPHPATVHPEPLPAEVVDSDGRPVRISGRGLMQSPPARFRIAGRPWTAVAGWSAPWPVDERWWDKDTHRRRARLQLLGTDDTAVLATLENGRWWMEATYD